MNLTNLKVEATDMGYAKSWILFKKKKWLADMTITF